MLKHFYKNHKEALNTISEQKNDIECNNGICKRSLSIPDGVYNNWYSNMQSITETDNQEAIQRKFSVLCSRLFENKEDYYLSHGSAEESIVRDRGNHLYISYENIDHKKVKQQFKDAFIVFRKHMQHTDKLSLIVDTRTLTMYATAKYLINTSYTDHILGYLLMETLEKPIYSIEIYSTNMLVKSCIRKIINASSITYKTEHFIIH